jgi:hypothetical protein
MLIYDLRLDVTKLFRFWLLFSIAGLVVSCSGDEETQDGSSNYYADYGEPQDDEPFVPHRYTALTCRYQNEWYSYGASLDPDELWDVYLHGGGDSSGFDVSYWRDGYFDSESEEACIYSGLELFSAVLGLFDEIDGIYSLLGGLGLRESGLTAQQGMNIVDILDGFIAPIFEQLSIIENQASWQLEHGCDCYVPDGLQVYVPPPEGIQYSRRYRMYGIWGKPEKTAALFLVNLINAFEEFIFAHNLNFDLTNAISLFGDVEIESGAANLPVLLNSLAPLLTHNPDFLELSLPQKLAAGKESLQGAFSYAAVMLRENLIAQTDENSFLYFVDRNANQVLDGGDLLALNMGLAIDERVDDDPEVPHLVLPECGANGLPDDNDDNWCVGESFEPELLGLLENKLVPAMQRATVNCEVDDNQECIMLSEIGAVLGQLGLLEKPLPEVLKFDPVSYFINPQSLRALLFRNSLVVNGIMAEGELADSSCNDNEGIYAGCGDFVFLGDRAHFNNALKADGVFAPTAFQLSLVAGTASMPGNDFSTFVLPYLFLGDGSFNGSVYYDLSGFSAEKYKEISGIAQPYPSRFSDLPGNLDFSNDGAGMPETAGCNNDMCRYEAAKLLAIYFLESGVLDP